MDISVIICTYNRCDSLRSTLEGFCSVEVAKDVKWELIVIDNNSSDATPEVCHSFENRIPIRYVFEPRQGHSRSRNRGISEAAYDLILFTDDDVDVDKNWVMEMHRAAERNPEASFLGGKVCPFWATPPALWVGCGNIALCGMIMSIDHGDTEHRLAENQLVVGANMAFRKSALAGESFREDLGKVGLGGILEDETELMRRLIAKGGHGVYVPLAVVFHRNEPQRGTEAYLRSYFIGYGRTLVRVGNIQDDKIKLLGAPRYLWRKLISEGLTFFWSRLTKADSVWVTAEVEMSKTWGAIVEFRHQSGGK